METSHFPAAVAASLLSAVLSVQAQSSHDHHNMPATESASASAAPLPWVEAEVRRVDTAAGKISLRHGDIPNLDMPGMTMVFQMQETSQLNGLKAGDQVRFTAVQAQGAYVVQQIEKAP